VPYTRIRFIRMDGSIEWEIGERAWGIGPILGIVGWFCRYATPHELPAEIGMPICSCHQRCRRQGTDGPLSPVRAAMCVGAMPIAD
jgi:hypothetical protein